MDEKRERLIRNVWGDRRHEPDFSRGPVWVVPIQRLSARQMVPQHDYTKPLPLEDYTLSFRLETGQGRYRVVCEGLEVEAGEHGWRME